MLPTWSEILKGLLIVHRVARRGVGGDVSRGGVCGDFHQPQGFRPALPARPSAQPANLPQRFLFRFPRRGTGPSNEVSLLRV